MLAPLPSTALAFALALASSVATAGPEDAPHATHISYAQSLARARLAAPDIAIARGREAVAEAEVGVAGTYPNPSVLVGTTTQTAKLSVGASVPLVVFGQRGAAIDASQADLATVRVDSQVTWSEVRAQTAHAYVALWSSEQIALARTDAAALASRLEKAVVGRVEVGAAPEVDGLRVKAERLRAEADADEAAQLVSATSADLARFVGITPADSLRAGSEPDVPEAPPPLGELLARAGENPSARREASDALAAEARVRREHALLRPGLTLDLGADVGDATIANSATNYRAQLAVEVPLFSQRGGYVARERASAAAARSRSSAEQQRARAAVEVAYRTFVAASGRMKALGGGVVPAARAAAKATEESYTLGRAPLVAVLEAERARLDAEVSLVDARGTRANAWIDVERALGTP